MIANILSPIIVGAAIAAVIYITAAVNVIDEEEFDEDIEFIDGLESVLSDEEL